MGNFTLKTDSYLDQFALFRAINKLLGPEGYQDTKEDKQPSLYELLSDKMYHEWLDLADLVAETDNWDEEDWKNFNVCMSLAESCKNRVDSISYALEGLGWNFTPGTKNQMTVSDKETIIKIYVDNINTPPRLDQIREKLKRCIEYLIIAKDPRIEFDITTVNMNVNLDSNSINDEIVATSLGIFLEAESHEDYTVISISIQDTQGTEVSDVTSYWSSDYEYGYIQYNVRIIDEGSHQVITDPSLYEISAKYQVGNSNFKMDTIILDENGWIFQEDGVSTNYGVNTYVRQVTTEAAHYILGQDMKFLMAPSNHESQLIVGEAGVFIDPSEISEGYVYFRCLHIPRTQFSVEFASYTQHDYEAQVERFTVKLEANRWNSTTNTITVSAPQVKNLGIEFLSSNIPSGELMDTCNSHEIRINSISKGKIQFKCETIPSSTLFIPIELVSTVGLISNDPINVSSDNPIPSAYFDVDNMIIWVVKGAGHMDYTAMDILLTASYIDAPESVNNVLHINWNEVPQT